jgi:hypothetical protein
MNMENFLAYMLRSACADLSPHHHRHHQRRSRIGEQIYRREST